MTNLKRCHSVSIAQPNIRVRNILALLGKDAQPFIVFQKRDRSLRNSLYTIVALDPSVTVSIKGRNASLKFSDGTFENRRIDECPFEFLRSIQTEYAKGFDLREIDKSIEFAAGMIGYFGFGLIHTIEDVKRQTSDPLDVPDSVAIVPQTIISIDHQAGTVNVLSQESMQRAEELAVRLVFADSFELADEIFATQTSSREDKVRFESVIRKEQFIENVDAAKQFIEEGQCFQIVLSQRFFAKADISATEIFVNLLETAPSTYNYLLSFPEFQYLGASPETMVNVKGNRIQLCALAGTRPRGKTQAQDKQNECELKRNEKELAEHRMLVDLGRNDLGKVCRAGSIQVGPIAQVLKYSNVMHLGTEISGQLEDEQDSFSALKACFPRGTVSGAPKVRAMELLAELETEQRGIYSGAVGFFDIRGHMDTAIAIRSALLKDGEISVNAGAGIVYDSVPEHEYMETVNKARAIIQVIENTATNVSVSPGRTSIDNASSGDSQPEFTVNAAKVGAY
ncbi:anthranilate synthase component I family protein [Candidatus Obscuribacterales bacterium]|nr:anthranilate synthase component I family protein [Candidatus Obscuribacterales bacterium]